MVLAELGAKLRDSLRQLHHSNSNVTEKQITAILGDISRALIESDVNVKTVMELRDSIKQRVTPMLALDDNENNPPPRSATHISKVVQKAVVDELVRLLSPSDAKRAYTMRKGKPNVILFVGLQGSGKTTTIAKFANYYQRRGWKTCMVGADTFRAGAYDQIRQNGTKLRIPFYGSFTEADPVVIAQDGVKQFVQEKYEVILVDTSGRHKQETALLEEMQEIAAVVRPDNTILVMDATQGQAVYDQALAFSATVQVGAVIVTKLDGHAKGGGALSAVAATQSPILFLGTGEHFDDLEPFYAQSFVSKLLGFGDVRGLMEAMKSDPQTQQELMDKMSKGEFTLRKMYEQFEKVLKMGPMSKVMSMMPGMPEYLIPKSGDEQANHRLRKFMVIMDSMTKAELDGRVDLQSTNDPTVKSRIRRIAAGSGSHPDEVKMLLQAHGQFAGVVQHMNKAGYINNGKTSQAKQQQQLASQLRKNPNLLQQRLNQMDPRMIQQMGGREHVLQMMQQVARGGGGGGAGGGMPDMSTMMGSAMGGGGGGMPDMASMMAGQPGGGMPNMEGMDMEQMVKMAQSMGLGPAGMPRR